MAKKVIIIADPGIDSAFAIALAMHDPNIDLLGLIPCAGNVSAQQATANVQVLIDELDPIRWPRTGSALAVEYAMDGIALHGPGGLGGVPFDARTKHQQVSGDKILSELVREHPHEITLICLGPLTTLARTLDRDSDFASLIGRIVVVGGCWKEPGNAGPAAEFHFYLDPEAARRVFRQPWHLSVVPLDVTRRLILSPSELLELPNADSKTSRFLRQIIPYGIRASSNLYGIEGFHLKDVLGVAAVALDGCVSFEHRSVGVESKGELTRGMMVVDARKQPTEPANARVGVEVAIGEVKQYISRVLSGAA